MPEFDYDPDKYLWGIFYYDPEDPRIFIPKTIRWMGFTVNFANPLSFLVIFLIIALAIFLGTLEK